MSEPLTKRRALITGITGQDGAYLARLLLDRGYEVYGSFRRTASTHFWRIEALGIRSHPDLHLVEHDLTDFGSAIRVLERTQPAEVYNLAAQSFVGVSFGQPVTTGQISGLGALNLLEAIRVVDPRIRFYQASTSEMFGKAQEVPQTEDTPFYPRSPYGVAKLFAHWSTVNYRESYGIFGTSGILFNHESPLRGLEFVTRKVTHGVAGIALGRQSAIELGNLDARRDWGYAADYVDGMWRMLQVDEPDTFVLSTGRTESVRSFVQMAFEAAGIEVSFSGQAEQEVGVVAAVAPEVTGVQVGQTVLRVNPAFYRPAEVDLLVGRAEKAKEILGWEPSTTLETLCHKMVQADLTRHRSGEACW